MAVKGRRVVSSAGHGNDVAPASRRRNRALKAAIVSTATAFAVLLVAAASASAFSTRGSVDQVDVTGLAANAQAALVSPGGATVSTQEADSLGGLLFRNVKPGRGYRVRVTSTDELSEPVTVHTTASAPWDPSVYNQEIP